MLAIQFKSYSKNSNSCFAVSKAALEIQDGSEYLTGESRFFILTYDPIHMENYFHERDVTKRREYAIETISKYTADKKTIESLELALAESKKLEETELYAIRLVVDGKHIDKFEHIPEDVINVKLLPEDQLLNDDYKVAKAWLMLFSEEYMQKKKMIADLNAQALTSSINYTENVHTSSSKELEHSFFLILILVIIIFAIALSFIIALRILVLKPIYRNVKNIKEDKKLDNSYTKEFNILTSTYNDMYEKTTANEILLRHKAEHDELTGLLNRSAYTQVQKALYNADCKIALILIDIDFFKIINDNYGHPVGDKVIRRVASVIKQQFRATDYIARIGGDEFAVVLTDCDSNQKKVTSLISVKMSKAKEILQNPEDDIPPVTLSCGIELSNKGYSETLYEHADAALYEVKRSGRNGFKFYSNDMGMLLSQIEDSK